MLATDHYPAPIMKNALRMVVDGPCINRAKSAMPAKSTLHNGMEV
jgi:hypothetical protein